ncbi:PHP-like protein [Desulfosarcina ovata subsp. sediminis]|uniref:PHP-like protein n=1 Tax=Desulfosarcina ovata subsp. sediminis TaxID=885957 RepID=A0A5K7ZU73_9BACT|nr:PHP domain-containing protein [Desulfosarcina ovata]BBO83758.1 PHP-like protein [Desulfosarcina ovata subsp. sediminis]
MKKPLVSDARPGIDLHIHSTASDGSLTPSEILAMAVTLGLKAIAITDHDTLAGSVAAMASGIPPALQFLTGIEISAAAPSGYRVNGSVHILGYGIDPGFPELIDLLDRLKRAREDRNPQIIARLNDLGMDLSMQELDAIVGDAMAGRPHIAQLMIKKRLATSIDDAFDRFLGKNKPAYVHKYRAPMEAAIGAIRRAGGVAVLAHPHLNGINEPVAFEQFLLTLKAMGLRGIEAIYPDHSRTVTAEYCRLARKHDLLITGGTDFHGAATPGIQMGVGDGNFHVPYERYESLVAHLKACG